MSIIPTKAAKSPEESECIMEIKNNKGREENTLGGLYRKDAPSAIRGINTPGIELPAFNPPVPNRAWTAMRAGMDIDELTDEEREELYPGKYD